MKRYIRTPDGIYERIKHAYAYWGNLNEDRQADTIEELCDEFVVCFDSKVKPVRVDNSIFWAKHYAGKTGHIMGAIWTPKGLIYVAKMNDKGELELI